MRRTTRRAERGTSLLETLVAGAMLAIGVVGVGVAVVYQRNLEASTARLWAATCEATAEIEALRAASEASWGTLQAHHDGRTVVTVMRYRHDDADVTTDLQAGDFEIAGGVLTLVDGRTFAEGTYSLDGNGFPVADGLRLQKQIADVTTIAGDRLLVRIGDDPVDVDDGDLMWEVDAVAPNFYAVSIAPVSDDSEFGNRLRFQTYMADHGGLSSASTGVLDDLPAPEDVAALPAPESPVESADAAAFESPDAPERAFAFATYSDALADEAASLVVSGTSSEIASFLATNAASVGLPVTSVRVEIVDGVGIEEVVIGGTTIYRGAAVAQIEEDTELQLPPGDVEIQIAAEPPADADTPPIDGAEIRVRLTFSDGSESLLVVQP